MGKMYSFSRIKLFTECKHAYFLSYVAKSDKKVNVYSEIGSTIHEMLEDIQDGKDIPVEERLKTFEDKVDELEIFGIEFPNESIKERYIANIKHCLQDFIPLKGKEFEIEKEINLEVGGYKLTGYVDLIVHNEDGTVSVVDFKTSSKYTKKDIVKNANQLIIYGMALESMGYQVRDISWLMLKYVTVKGKRGHKMIERRELEHEQEYEQCFVKYDYNETTKKECTEWIINTIDEIESLDGYNGWDAKEIGKYNSFYCSNICSVSGGCESLKKFLRSYRNNY